MERDIEKLKRWIIRKKLEGKLPVSSICIQARISRKMFYYWWSRYQTLGWGGLQKKPKGRPCGPKLEDPLQKKIIKLRKRYEWGPNKIAGYLGHRGYTVDHHQVYSVICEAGLNNPIIEPRKTWERSVFKESITTASGKLTLSSVTMIVG